MAAVDSIVTLRNGHGAAATTTTGADALKLVVDSSVIVSAIRPDERFHSESLDFLRGSSLSLHSF
jgi:hypothetical protein